MPLVLCPLLYSSNCYGWVPDASISQTPPFSGGLPFAFRSPLTQWCLLVSTSHQSGGCAWPVTENCRGLKAQSLTSRPNNLSVAVHTPELFIGSAGDWTFSCNNIFAKLLLLSHPASLSPLEVSFQINSSKIIWIPVSSFTSRVPDVR